MNIDKTIKRPVLRYHGGKFLLAPWIVSHFPAHRIYVEPFGGGGSVLMRKERSYAEVYNDKGDTVVNVFRVLRDPIGAEQLKQALLLTPFARSEFNTTGELCLEGITDPIEKARRTILRSFAGFGSASTNALHSTGFRANCNRSGLVSVAREWAGYPDHLVAFIERLRGVVVENRDWLAVVLQNDSPDTLIYLDPPYVHSTRNMARGNARYAHELTDEDHVNLADKANSFKGMVVLSGYNCGLYKGLFSTWQRFDKETLADGARKRTESLWLNPAAYTKLLAELL